MEFPFPILDANSPLSASTPPFTVSTHRGFLPINDPPASLPPSFAPLESLLSRMPIVTADGTPGLLASGNLGETVEKELPDLSEEVEKFKDDAAIMNAIYRDYSFLLSAYLLEPCHLRFLKGEGYGLGRQRLPAVIAKPMVKVSEIAGFKPFMEYAGSYALYNYRFSDPSLGLTYSNLRLVRAFEQGLDPTSSEAGFVFVHINMVSHSGLLISGGVEALNGASLSDRTRFDKGMKDMLEALKEINKVMDTMWNKSKPNGYNTFRTFIFGITSQSMFPDGVVYEGVSEEPMSFRGESGANDSMIPLCDNLFQITMPDTPLTEILQDFRQYRPGNHREFLQAVKDHSDKVNFRQFALDDSTSAELYLRALDYVRDFRWRHWCFTREYILKFSKHPTATGGSPIVTWLPNQLQAVLALMIQVEPYCTNNDVAGEAGIKDVQEIMDLVRSQQVTLSKEVAKYTSERGGGSVAPSVRSS
ncbi:IDO-domain-containing protein [Lentinula guzmanii]|uniref:IDO-domain-containing protein n=2 Tax=Lentinula TaxID=5352 RepID=A0AA38MZ59_9AGAR|nr:IDO-domain-containing protein [Lentinula guzmanii]KAJ3781493.1 IDO-domain-containing protein [Lentinula aff. detonsa]KAJ3793846.1 IDO-domain-containing protein [Lentinula aff. detonsa]